MQASPGQAAAEHRIDRLDAGRDPSTAGGFPGSTGDGTQWTILSTFIRLQRRLQGRL
ncbi:MAG: hypothetical protein JNL80_06945 [Phycisphaerae bacterium]|nr:hypothetical protein [Phycisphaerae bacterium]